MSRDKPEINATGIEVLSWANVNGLNVNIKMVHSDAEKFAEEIVFNFPDEYLAMIKKNIDDYFTAKELTVRLTKI